MPDSSIYLFGSTETGTSPVKTDSGKGLIDYWLVHFKYVDTMGTGVGINEPATEQFTVYPNPTGEKLKIKNVKLRIEMVLVYDAIGKIILQKECKKENETEVDVSSLCAGMYFVQVKTQRGVYTQKVVKDK